MANIILTRKLNDHNFREWDIYFRGKLILKGMHQQYRHIEGYTHVRIAYEALVAHHKPMTKIDRIQVAMEWAKMSWDPRQETLPDSSTESNQAVKLLPLMPWEFRHIVDRLSNLPDSEKTVANTKIALEAEWKAAVRGGTIKTPRGQANEYRALFAACGGAPKEAVVADMAEVVARPEVAKPNEATSECRKKVRENGRPNFKEHRSDGEEDHSNAAVFMFSATESGDDDGQPTHDAAEDNRPIFLGEPREALPLRTDPDWHPTVQPVRLLFINDSPSPTWVTFMSRTNLEAMYHGTTIEAYTTVAEIPPWLTRRYLVTNPWLGPDANESYILDTAFHSTELTYNGDALNIRRNQRRHINEDDPEADFEVASSYDGSNDSDTSDMAYSVETSDTRTIEHRIVVDSGASAHMTGASEHLVTVATTMGKLNISTPSRTTLTLTDVLLIKGMSTTLLSIPMLMRANPNVHLEFQQDACTILLGYKSVARATMSNDQRLPRAAFSHQRLV
ncbi:hypothetical protein H310_01798 [Aphanomyces invadans]|uniref:Uncharacterized protein n=1 Tax=Aphanomyces invadans TaxID=157072 RepID=A0A024ULM8_9STRA|nr:hypothetical protein H310_01798 [Aphanomyces invadans]ETW07209.1 hypothetical protein H310_01798 [Aphanomyces invadans]|eukprot:XP_008863302.1 hypothetical protein H310_01798 [Aphanomyces invadans]